MLSKNFPPGRGEDFFVVWYTRLMGGENSGGVSTLSTNGLAVEHAHHIKEMKKASSVAKSALSSRIACMR
jgi:hypothetical protein